LRFRAIKEGKFFPILSAEANGSGGLNFMALV